MSNISGSPTLLHVDDVEAAVRFLQDAFGLCGVGSCEGEGDAQDERFEMLENQSGSVQVVVLPKSADVVGGTEDGGCATLTLATDCVRLTAATAVRAGARLLRSHRVPLRAETETNSEISQTAPAAGGAGAETAAAASAAADGGRVEEAREGADTESGLAWLGGPPADVRNGSVNGDDSFAVRVLLVDERLLLARRRSRRPEPPPGKSEDAVAAADNGSATVDAGASGPPLAETGAAAPKTSGALEEGSGGLVATEAGVGLVAKETGSPSASVSEQTTDDNDGHKMSTGGPASGRVAAAPKTPLLLSGLASLSEAYPRETFYSCSSGLGDSSFSCGTASGEGSMQQIHPADAEGLSESGATPPAGRGVALGNGSSGGSGRDAGSWFSQEELVGEQVDGGGSGDGGGGDDDAALSRAICDSKSNGVPASGPPVRPQGDKGKDKEEDGDLDGGAADADGDNDVDREATTVEASTDGSSAGITAGPSPSASGVVKGDDGDADVLDKANSRMPEVCGEGQPRPTARAQRQRPFRQLETFMLGNEGGPLKASPNSIAPIPINNEHFEGLALLMLKREPMDKRYAGMFEGKNRMFEVQVQGRFKKPPDGELYISLEITDRMKLGLLTKGLCKLLLSFGQKLNRRLHYSFGDKENLELPHIAFPLVSSVDSLICTPNGEEVPILGRPFQEDKERKASRKRGEEDNAAGIGKFQTGCTYSFSFHSMYIDMAQWSTCKIPVMRDIDLHTFWGSSALRVAAYVIKSSSETATQHLQSKLEYVFCVQVRHLPHSEHGDGALEEQEGEWDDGDDTNAPGRATEEATATVTLSAKAGTAEVMTTTMLPAGAEDEDENGDGEKSAPPGVGDEIILPLLTDREPSPRGRQMSASRWASNDDASDGEQDDRQARRERRSRRRRGRKTPPSSSMEARAMEAIVAGTKDGRGSGGSSGNVGGGDGDGEAGDDSEDDESQSSTSDSIERSSGEVAEATAARAGKEQTQAAAAAAGDAEGDTARSSALLRATTGGVQTAWRGEFGDAAAQQQQQGGAAGKLSATIASPGREGGGGGRSGLKRGSTEVGEDGAGGDDVEDAMVRCPAYVDLYARSPKLQGTWTVYVVVKRGSGGKGKGGGEFALRSSKNLSILPANVAPTKVQYSPRLSRREVKRRKLDTVLQLLTASSHAHAHRSHQVVIRAVLGMESSADRAYRHYSPAPSASTSKGSAKADSRQQSTAGSRRGSRTGSYANVEGDGGEAPSSLSPGLPAENCEEIGTFSAGISVDRALTSSSPAAAAAATEGGSSHGDDYGYGEGQPAEAEGDGEDDLHAFSYSPRPSSASLASIRSGGSEVSSTIVAGSGRRRSWSSRSASLVKEGMVLRVLSEHHLSQQVAVLDPSSLTFSRPRKQCLRLLTRDIMSVELGGGGAAEDGVWSTSPESQLIPGMFLVEIHTVGRVHYMLVEGIHEAQSWASAIRDAYLHRARGDGKSSPPQDDLSISDPFSQYMTKKSAWRASNFWVLNCRRALEIGGSAAGATGWGGGCWMDEGGMGGQVCDFVAGLLRQALELNDDSKPEQLIAFLDDICSLRWMPLEGLSQSEQLAVFLNLYHVMLLHAFFILGPPGSPLRVASYFTTLCYEVGGDVLSMADLEHCVLRAKTSQPKQFLSKLIIPTTEYPFSLRQPEPRVSFALNCGSVSGVPGILIYRPESVFQQLDDASTYYVQSISEVLVGKRTVILPKIISWYADDFNAKAEESGGAISSSLSCLLQVKRYFTGEKRRQIEGLLSDGGSVSVKFESWNWKCRPVTLVSESELASLCSNRAA